MCSSPFTSSNSSNYEDVEYLTTKESDSNYDDFSNKYSSTGINYGNDTNKYEYLLTSETYAYTQSDEKNQLTENNTTENAYASTSSNYGDQTNKYEYLPTTDYSYSQSEKIYQPYVDENIPKNEYKYDGENSANQVSINLTLNESYLAMSGLALS